MIYQDFGNKKEDYQKSNLSYEDNRRYNYEIKCEKCGQTIYRQRYNENFIRNYRCGICGGKFTVYKIIYK